MYRRSALAVKILSTENELDRFDLLTEAALSAEAFPEEYKTNENRLLSCETRTWYRLGYDGYVKLTAESDSLFVKGLCCIIADIAKRIRPCDVCRRIGFADACFEKGVIDAGRRKGLISLEEKTSEYAKEVLKNEKSN